MERSVEKRPSNASAVQCAIVNSAEPGAPPKQFTFDGVYYIDSTSEQLYNEMVFPLVEVRLQRKRTNANETIQNVLEGYNGTVFAYGQTGSGKTFTMQVRTLHANIRISQSFVHFNLFTENPGGKLSKLRGTLTQNRPVNTSTVSPTENNCCRAHRSRSSIAVLLHALSGTYSRRPPPSLTQSSSFMQATLRWRLFVAFVSYIKRLRSTMRACTIFSVRM